MIGTRRASITGALIISVMVGQSPLFAEAGSTHSPRRVFSDTAIAHAMAPVLAVAPAPRVEPSQVLAQRYFGRRGRRRRSTAMTAVVLGSAAAITGGALLAYANRPECDTNATANGCGYGYKVVGGSVLAGGVVGVTLGALMWPH